MMDNLRQEISQFLRFTISDSPVTFETNEIVEKDGYRQLHIHYSGQDGSTVANAQLSIYVDAGCSIR